MALGVRLGWAGKIALGTGLLLAASLALFVAIEGRRVRQITREELRLELLSATRLLAHAVSGADLNSPSLPARIRGMASSYPGRLTIIAGDGRVLADSEVAEIATMENHRFREEVAQALARGEAIVERPSRSVGRTLLYAAARVPGSDAVARIARDTSRVEREVGRPADTFLGFGAALLVLAGVGAALFGRSLGRRVRRLTLAVNAVEEGSLELRSYPRGGDDIGRLGEAFQALTLRLKAALDRAAGEAARLGTILDAMEEGVVAVDGEERLSFLNDAARRVLELPAGEAVEGRRLYELVRDPTILGLVQSAREQARPVSGETAHDGPPRRLLQIHAAPVGGGSPGVILVLRDLSRLRQLERMRSDFVSNVSHELRTPLAAISASAENLEEAVRESDAGAAQRFVGAIRRNAERLQTLIDDILALSRLESRPETLERVSVDFGAIVRGAAEDLRERAVAAGLALEVQAPLRVSVVGDAGALRRIADNLILNAVSYTPKGGRVEVSVRMEEGQAVLRVADTGIGIPQAEVERIFERFYRIDKARSRSAGGTGLGLSIVKHAVGLHGGTIRVESTVGVGSVFTVSLPAAHGGDEGAKA